MAIVTPILLMILAGIFDFGFLFRSWEVVTNAAREGARVGVFPPTTATTAVRPRHRVDAYMASAGVRRHRRPTRDRQPARWRRLPDDFTPSSQSPHDPAITVAERRHGRFLAAAFTSVHIRRRA